MARSLRRSWSSSVAMGFLKILAAPSSLLPRHPLPLANSASRSVTYVLNLICYPCIEPGPNRKRGPELVCLTRGRGIGQNISERKLNRRAPGSLCWQRQFHPDYLFSAIDSDAFRHRPPNVSVGEGLKSGWLAPLQIQFGSKDESFEREVFDEARNVCECVELEGLDASLSKSMTDAERRRPYSSPAIDGNSCESSMSRTRSSSEIGAIAIHQLPSSSWQYDPRSAFHFEPSDRANLRPLKASNTSAVAASFGPHSTARWNSHAILLGLYRADHQSGRSSARCWWRYW